MKVFFLKKRSRGFRAYKAPSEMKIVSVKKTGLNRIMRQIQNLRSHPDNARVETTTRAILEQVRKEGDKALMRFSEKFDHLKLSSFKVSAAEIKEAYRSLDSVLLKALKQSRKNIETFHRSILNRNEPPVQTEKGVKIWRVFRPIEKVGLYVPGGKAAYPSTVLMLSVPAKIAGCKEIVLCTPPLNNGKCSSVVLAAAALCGITRIYKVGGAGAIAAMAYGTQTIPKVSKIFGPGNQYVTTAKMMVFGTVDIDMPAGPSEVLVVADDKANVKWVAADLLSQLEHGEDSQSILVTFSQPVAEKVIREMSLQMKQLSRRSIIEKSFQKSVAVVVNSINEAAEIVNQYAPEHLEIVTRNPAVILKKINNAGSIFLGEYTNEPLGDYVTGANHTLPTSGYAKMFSPLSTGSFGKMIQVQEVTRSGIGRLRLAVSAIAASEGLDAHKNAVAVRFS